LKVPHGGRRVAFAITAIACLVAKGLGLKEAELRNPCTEY